MRKKCLFVILAVLAALLTFSPATAKPPVDDGGAESAGAALAGPDMSPLAPSDDPGQEADTTCLGIVDFVVLPHADRRSAGDLNHRQRVFGARFDLRPLRDRLGFAVSVDGVREVRSA